MFEIHCQGAVHVIWGDLPMSREHVPELGRLLGGVDGAGQPWLVLDMKEIPLLDSAGLEFLLDVQDRLEARGGQMKLCSPNPLCRDILHASGVGRRFEMHKHARAAIGSFNR
jgi:anti-anti-sigma factor